MKGGQMIAHVKMLLWSFSVLWQFKSIPWKGCFYLWKKSFNLYLCFLGFTDKERLDVQLKAAMKAAVLSSVYDYETDLHISTGVRRGLFKALLEEFVSDDYAKKIAYNLFCNDIQGKLSSDGLERGSQALTFYCAVIQGKWMSHYSPEQINKFGRLLQIVDDLIDFEKDKITGDKNCFLTAGFKLYLAEAKTFLESDFYRQLEENSWVYIILKCQCIKTIQILEGNAPKFNSLIASHRPLTGIFAIFLTLIGFSFFNISWIKVFLTATLIAGFTYSIMLFNDLIDRNHDAQKGKTFARDYSWDLARVWGWGSVFVLVFLVLLGVFDVWLAFFGMSVWALGILYSFIPHWYIAQNIVVALCSASPVLFGMISIGKILLEPLLTFGIIASTIFLREIVKDIEDQKFDLGYKKTLPIKCGHVFAVMFVISGCYLPASFLLLYPNWIVKSSVLFFVPIELWCGLTLLKPERIYIVKKGFDLFLITFMATLLAVP